MQNRTKNHRILGATVAGLLTLTAACGNGSGRTGGASAPTAVAAEPGTTTTIAPTVTTATTPPLAPAPAPTPVTAKEAPAPVDLTEVDAFLATLDSELAGADEALATSEGDF